MAKIEDVGIQVGFEPPALKGISYCCPSCNVVLSVEIDPVAMKADIINGVVAELRGQL